MNESGLKPADTPALCMTNRWCPGCSLQKSTNREQTLDEKRSIGTVPAAPRSSRPAQGAMLAWQTRGVSGLPCSALPGPDGADLAEQGLARLVLARLVLARPVLARLALLKLVLAWSGLGKPVLARPGLARMSLCLCLLGVAPFVSAAAVDVDRDEMSTKVEIRAENAPLGRTLQKLLEGREAGIEVRVSEEIDDHLSGRLVGTVDDLLDLLIETHGLEMYRRGKTIWFDRKGRSVVDFVKMDEASLLVALKSLASPIVPGGNVVVEAGQRGLVFSGTREYVQKSLARIALATGQLVPDVGRRPVRPVQRAPGLSLDAAAKARQRDEEPEDAPLIGGAIMSASLASTPLSAGVAAPPVAAPAVPILSLEDPGTGTVLGARIVLVSSSEPQVVVLADGREFRSGGRLPNGHRIVNIERDRIILERDGSATILAMP